MPQINLNPSGNYIKVSLLLPDDQFEETIALLNTVGFEGFEEEPGQLHAFIPESDFNAESFRNVLSLLRGHTGTAIETLKPRNWNEEWERNFQPVEIEGFVQVIPSFKTPKAGFEHTLWIEPKMSFGTGHHETTRLMMRFCREVDFHGKKVLDMGCGTGILGILALKLGAESLMAVDNDPACVENSKENAALNKVSNIEICLGGAEILPQGKFDIILANINRNVLLEDGRAYYGALKPGGLLAMSGFFDFDANKVSDFFTSLGMEPSFRNEENGWVLLAFRHKMH